MRNFPHRYSESARVPTTLLMRRAFAAALAAALASSAAPAVAAADPRAERDALLVRIADLTDRLEDAEMGVVKAQFQQQSTSVNAARTRAVVRAHAVNAYMHGNALPEGARRGPAIYLEVAARKHRAMLTDATDAQVEAKQARDEAEAARVQLRTANAELNRARELLDAEVAADDARRAEEKRRADEAARRADEARRQALLSRTAAQTGLRPRHKLATQRQVDLMARYPFGPLPSGAVPSGLRATGQRIEGLASWYGPGFHGRATASGAIYDQEGWTTASRDLPLGTMLVVSRGDRHVLLLVNDRGPYVYDRVLDLSHAAAVALGVGVTPVVAEVVAPTG